jgi:hypothetical protein
MGIFLGDKPVSVFFNGASASLPVQGVFLGGIQVFPTGTAATVPDAPVITAAVFDFSNGETRVVASGQNNGADVTAARFVFSESGEKVPDGVNALEIFDDNGTYSIVGNFTTDYSGETVQVFATNSVGESEGSDPVEVTVDF